MRFRPDLAQLIVNGRKTEHRLPVRARHRCEPMKAYAVQPEGEKQIARLWVLEIVQQDFDDLEHQDVLAEGFKDLKGFMEYWRDRYGVDIDWGDRMWVLRFELYRDQDRVFVPPRDTVRSLRVAYDPGSPADGVGPERRRAPEPEPVDPVTIKAYAKGAREKWALNEQQREAIYRSLSLEDKLRMVREDARLRVAGRNDLRVIEQRLEAIWNRGKKAA